ncbi:MAG: alpha/beta hydrolase [Rhodospirillaceae bacterium]|nr:alpha/beta hydrolase [Rhodospirillaceae bacterium]
MKQRLALSDESTLSYVENGTGKPVIFIPGWTYTTRVFARNLPVIGEHYRVLAYDPRSHGDSSVTADGNNYDRHGADLHEFITQLGVENCIIAGWSLGASAAYSYFEKYGAEKVSGFISIDESPKIRKDKGSDWGEGEEDELQATLETLKKYGHLKFFEDYLRHCYVGNPENMFVQEMLNEAAKTPEPVAFELIRNCFDLDYREVARRIDREIPVMQVVREDWRQAAREWISENQPNAGICYMPAHLSFHEFAGDFNRQVLEFCSRCL